MTFNLEDYETVDERIEKFFEKYPEGSLQSELIRVEQGWLCKAFAYRKPDDERPGVGHAVEPVPGKTPYTKDSEAMNAETSARGRAIIALGLGAKKNASREEVEARQSSAGAGERSREDAPADPHYLKDSRADAVGDGEVKWGKHKGKKIADVPASYWEWWLGSDMAAKPDFAEFRAQVELHLGLTSATAPGAPADLDIPFAASWF